MSRGPLAPFRAALMVLVLAGCAGALPVQVGPPAGAPGGFPTAAYLGTEVPAGRRYRIVPEASELRLYVYRGGRLARLGHNHLISTRAIGGFVLVAEDPRQSRADLYVPVASLEVDLPVLRRQAGPEFSSEPSAQDIAATRKNMLSPAVLDGEHFPYVSVAARIASGELPRPVLDLAVTLRGTTRHWRAPARVDLQEGELRIVGELRLRQSELAITPFSVLGGALTVQDELRLGYAIVARAL